MAVNTYIVKVSTIYAVVELKAFVTCEYGFWWDGGQREHCDSKRFVGLECAHFELLQVFASSV